MEFEEDVNEQPPTTAFVELTTLEGTSTTASAIATGETEVDPIVVETVPELRAQQETSDEHVSNLVESTVEQIFPQKILSSIQCAMTLLFCLLVPAAFLTLRGVSKPHTLLLACVWSLLAFLFIGLVWVVKAAIQEQQVFHPYIHAVTDGLWREVNNLREDCRHEMLLLTDGPADEENEDTELGQQADNDMVGDKKRGFRKKSGRKPKSVVFRVVVKPFMPLFARRRKRRKAKQEAEAMGCYQPPSTDIS